MSDEWAWNDEALAIVEEPAQPEATHGHTHGRHRFGFDGEKYPGGWQGPDHFVDTVLGLDYFTLRQRSQEIFETNLYGRGIIKRLVTNEVHTGLSLEADPNALLLGRTEDELSAWSDRVEALWGTWADTPEVCDFERRDDMTHGEMTAAARREALVGGDVLIVTRTHAKTKLPTIQLIGGHLIQTPFPIPTGKRIEMGVELDPAGRHVAYYVRDERSLTFTRITAKTRSGRRSAWLMYGVDRRVGQVRGTPLLGIVLQSLNEIDKYRDSTQRKAVINSILTMWIEKTENKVSSLPMSGAATRTDTINDVDHHGQPRSYNVADQIPGVVLEELQVRPRALDPGLPPGSSMRAGPWTSSNDNSNWLERPILITR